MVVFIEIYPQIRVFSEFGSKKRAKTISRDTIAIKIKKLYLQQIYAGIHKINEDGYKNTANIRDSAQ